MSIWISLCLESNLVVEMVMDVDIVLHYRIVLVVNVDVVSVAWVGVIRLIVFPWRAVGGTVAAGGGWPRERRKKLIWNVVF